MQLCFFAWKERNYFFMGSDSLFFIIIAICLIMSAYFSATETAFLSLNRIRMKNMADKGNKRAALVLELEEKYDNLLSTILIGNNIVNILSSSLATILFVKMLGDAKGASVSTIVTTVLVLSLVRFTKKHCKRITGQICTVFRTDHCCSGKNPDTG